ncbi:cupin domain-containing protein [Flavobacterium salilacus subsp. salilacus]|uniref:cupin domain-containing protein n=1 Tax=Flavobacterium TaxID=237 RepID=UPI001074BFE7|nr:MULTISPECIES: cupin domain-containing protein [Flavobacterium]KAF2518609.1 cupin domain-containing protein [Flavobacterium salilacus subsp. salilacus]MBE1613566.1 cupin domain-containing protein [Flavobacterium sp. SaA2.13]
METKHDDTVIGRARVQNTPELEAYYKELESLGAGALWTVANDIEPWEPRPSSVPMLWKYDDLRDLVIKSSELVTPEQAGRRVVYLVNDKRKDVSAAVGWLYTGIQVTKPGESTPAHKHKAAALRFIMEGEGGYTVVDGNRITLEVNDFVITPNSTWHEHGVEEGGKTCIWQDGLDIPLVNALEANDYAVLDGKQELTAPVNFSPLAYGGVGLVPADHVWDKPYSPLFKYSWKKVYPALLEAAQVHEGSPYDGVLMHYTNPVTGGHVMQTMGASMQLLRAGEHTKAHKHTGSFVYQCAKGKGYSVIGGKRYDWKERDIFCVPSWVYHEHVNLSKTEDACLFSFNDLPVITSLGLYQEKAHPDGHQTIE